MKGMEEPRTAWERVDEDHAEFTGKVERWGALVCERYIWVIWKKGERPVSNCNAMQVSPSDRWREWQKRCNLKCPALELDTSRRMFCISLSSCFACACIASEWMCCMASSRSQHKKQAATISVKSCYLLDWTSIERWCQIQTAKVVVARVMVAKVTV